MAATTRPQETALETHHPTLQEGLHHQDFAVAEEAVVALEAEVAMEAVEAMVE